MVKTCQCHRKLNTVKQGYNENAWDLPVLPIVTVIRYNLEDLNS